MFHLRCWGTKPKPDNQRQALQHRSDTKMYRLQSPQTPLVRTQRYGEYHMDEFPSGTNMVVAVLAYTGAHRWPPDPRQAPLELCDNALCSLGGD